MLAGSGAKLLDFGLARLRMPLTTEAGPAVLRDGPTSNESAVVGTPAYMAPEQLKGVTADARSDLFAFGAVLYEMVSGHRAFGGGSQTELVSAILEHEPPPLSSPAGSVPQNLQRLVATCLAKDPDERWQTAKDLLRELRWVRDESGQREAAASDALRVSRRRVLATTMLMLAAALAAIGVAVAIIRSPAPSRISFAIQPPREPDSPRGGRHGGVARRHAAGVRGAVARWPAETVAASVRCGGEQAGRRQRERPRPVLVARWPLDRLLDRQRARQSA
jgi:hypothetical protein